MNEEELLEKLREAFSGEAEERLANLSSSLLALEKGADGKEKARALEVAFRDAHSLKGAARSVNLTDIETMCQAIEGVFAAMKREEVLLSGDLFDLLHRCVRAVEDSLAAPEGEGLEQRGEIAALVSQLWEIKAGKEVKASQRRAREKPEPKGEEILPRKKIEEKSAKDEGAKEKPAPKLRPSQDVRESPHKPFASESVRISTDKLDSLFLKAEELVSLKLASGQHLANLRDVVRSVEGWKKRWGEIEPELKMLNKMALEGDGSDNLSRFLDWNHDLIRSLGKDIWGLTKGAEQEGRTLGLMVDDLLDDMKKVTMLPFSTLLDIFPRMIREISRDQGKEVDLIVEGGEVEIDRRILEEMRDPITHLLRNSVDHGLEAPEKRGKQGKPRSGTILLTVSQNEGGKVEILISDDGTGEKRRQQAWA